MIQEKQATRNIFVILAAGLGMRMHSNQAKAMHEVAGYPMVEHIVSMLERDFGADKTNILVVVHAFKEQIITHLGNRVTAVEQAYALGTADAVRSTLPLLKQTNFDNAVILYGDVPFVQPETIRGLLRKQAFGTALTLLTTELEEPTGYGRIIRSSEDMITAIVEEKDASPQERKIKEVNTGIMAVAVDILIRYIPMIDDNNLQKEYYLTDLIGLLSKEHVLMLDVKVRDSEQVAGANNMEQLFHLEDWYQRRYRAQLLSEGLRLLAPEQTTIHGTIKHAKDCVIGQGVTFMGEVELGEQVRIEANCVIIDSKIGDGTHIKAFSYLDNVEVKEGCVVGPYARLRPETVLEPGVRVGNFVEIKKSRIKAKAKVNHLSYIGDADIGERTNVGAGTITCNYDGVNKHRTTLGDDVFVGSNSTLVAPLEVANNVFVAAGSVVSKSVKEPGGLVIARSQQQRKKDWIAPSASAVKRDN